MSLPVRPLACPRLIPSGQGSAEGGLAGAGFEARGFFFGAPLALALKVPFVPLRKPGKLPGPVLCPSIPPASAWCAQGSLCGHPGACQREPGSAAAGERIAAEYQLEYGSDKIEMHVGAVKPGDRVVLIDDLIATGGTLGAGIKLIKQVSRTVGMATVKGHTSLCAASDFPSPARHVNRSCDCRPAARWWRLHASLRCLP